MSPTDEFLQKSSRLGDGPIRLSTQAYYALEAGEVSREVLARFTPSALSSNARRNAESGNMVSELDDLRIVWRHDRDGGISVIGIFFADALEGA